jgi:hypothetical protein
VSPIFKKQSKEICTHFDICTVISVVLFSVQDWVVATISQFDLKIVVSQSFILYKQEDYDSKFRCHCFRLT